MPYTTKQNIPAASGYPQLQVLNHPTFAKGFTQTFTATTLAGHITSQDIIPKEIKDVGDVVVFRRPPVAEIFDYQKNQDLEVSHLSSATEEMAIGRAKYYNLKVDRVDEKQVADIGGYVRAFVESTKTLLADKVDNELLTEMPIAAAACNKGRNAGARTHMFDLGSGGSPITLTPANIVDMLTKLTIVLQEQNVDPKGFYAVFPLPAQALFFQNAILANAGISGLDRSVIIEGTIPNVMGFDIYFSNRMPMYDESGKVAYTILAGSKQATGFVNQMTVNETVDKDSRSFAKYWRGLTIYDFKVLIPEAVAVLYATIELQ